jgi:hypothetical protein
MVNNTGNEHELIFSQAEEYFKYIKQEIFIELSSLSRKNT